MRPPALASRTAVVGDQRIGRKRQRLIAEKQRQHVARKGRAQGRADRQGEEGKKAGLVFHVMAPHVADGVERGRYPQPRRDQRKEHTERLDLKGSGTNLGRPPPDELLGRSPAATLGTKVQTAAKVPSPARQGRHLAQIGTAAQKGDQGRDAQGQEYGCDDGGGGTHGATPKSQCAALRAIPAVSEVCIPKPMVRAMSSHAGICIERGASATGSASSGTGRK